MGRSTGQAALGRLYKDFVRVNMRTWVVLERPHPVVFFERDVLEQHILSGDDINLKHWDLYQGTIRSVYHGDAKS